MNIKEIIDKIRNRYEVRFSDQPSLIYNILDEIESEVAERIEELEAGIKALYTAIDGVREKAKNREELLAKSWREEFFQVEENADKRIAELEAQVPKVVVPVKGVCPVCGDYNHIFGVNKPYCGGCGAKLDWEDNK